jgi:hypothetical protein
MKILIENKSELTQFVSKIEKFIEGTYIKSKHQKIKECIAKSLNFEKYASLLSALPIQIETETFGFLYFTQSDKMFATKADLKKKYFAGRIHNEFIKDFICDDFDQCINKLMTLKNPEIFLDRGWGDQPLAISVINDGNGQFPYIYITNNIYKQLQKNNFIGGNVLSTYKARKLHVFDKTAIHKPCLIARKKILKICINAECDEIKGIIENIFEKVFNDDEFDQNKDSFCELFMLKILKVMNEEMIMTMYSSVRSPVSNEYVLDICKRKINESLKKIRDVNKSLRREADVIL